MRRNVARTLAVDRAPFKHRSRVAKDEIDVTFDVAVLVILPAAMREQRVLPTKKATVAKHSAIGVDVRGDCLRANTICIFEGDVLSPKVAAAKVSTVRIARVAGSLCTQVECYCRPQRIVSTKSDERFRL